MSNCGLKRSLAVERRWPFSHFSIVMCGPFSKKVPREKVHAVISWCLSIKNLSKIARAFCTPSVSKMHSVRSLSRAGNRQLSFRNRGSKRTAACLTLQMYRLTGIFLWTEGNIELHISCGYIATFLASCSVQFRRFLLFLY